MSSNASIRLAEMRRAGTRRRGRLLRAYAFVYRLDRWFERRFTATGRLAVGSMVVALLFSLNVHRAHTYKLSTLLVALVLTSFALSRLARGTLTVTLPGLATVGEPFEYTLSIANRGSRAERSLWLHDRLTEVWPEPGGRVPRYRRWLQQLHARRGARVAPVELPHVAPGEAARVRMVLTPTRRGYLAFASVEVGRPDPLGLARALTRYPQAGRALVLPRHYPVASTLLPGSGGRRGAADGVGPGIGQSDEFISLREYRPGDPLRHIHWKAWARLGEPIVKEYHEEADRRLVVLLDHCGVRAGEKDFEAAVEAAASLAVHALAGGAVVELAMADRSLEAGAGDGGSADLLLTALATLDGVDERARAAQMARLEAAVFQLSGLVCVVPAWDAGREALLARLLGLAVPVRVVAVCADAARCAAAERAAAPGAVVAATAEAMAATLRAGSAARAGVAR